jgi:hypothetical protein
MANPSDKSQVNVEKYEGPGKLSSAIDSGLAWGSTLWTLGIAAALGGKNINPKSLNWASVGVGAVAAFFGYRSAAKGEKQFESMKTRLAQSEMQVSELQTKVNDIYREASTTRKSFAQNLDSRSSHGSHASAVDADKANAAMAEPTR